MKDLKAFWQQLVAVEQAVEKSLYEAEEAAVHAVHDAGEAIITAERRVVKMTKYFLHMEAAGGIMLVLAALVALLIANSPLYHYYQYFLQAMEFRIGFSDRDMSFDAELRKSILLWINDGLMAVFFFLVGLEIKREFLGGELAHRDRILLPALAAFGGIAVPALFFWGFNAGDEASMAGWAIPTATDIAFALGVLALVGKRAPSSIKVLLLAIAVIDDIVAILIIAVFYSSDILIPPLYFAGFAVLLLFLLNRNNVTAKTPYFITSCLLWGAVLESGIHATIAGVVAAMFIPLKDNDKPNFSPLKTLEKALHPWVAFGVLPLFAFANAGVPLYGLALDNLFNPVSLGIATGLVAGKQIGVFSMLWVAIKTKLSPMPQNANWLQLYAISILCGIGFTMSLFIGTLAYWEVSMQAPVRIGVLGGSLFSALGGYLLLRYSTNDNHSAKKADQKQSS